MNTKRLEHLDRFDGGQLQKNVENDKRGVYKSIYMKFESLSTGWTSAGKGDISLWKKNITKVHWYAEKAYI